MTKMKLYQRLALCSAVGVLGACSDPLVVGPDAGDATTALVDKFCNDIAGPFCEANWTCCLMPGAHYGQTVDDCKTRFVTLTNNILSFCEGREAGTRADLEASLRAGTTIFDPTQFNACLTLLKSMAAGGTACVEPPGEVVERACLSAFRGQILPGAPCSWQDKIFWESIAQCKDGRCETGRCVPFLKPGDACDNLTDWAKPANTMCNYPNNEGCKPSGSDAGAGGACAPLGEIGDMCDLGPDHNFECKSWTCDGDAGKCANSDPYRSACYYSYP